MYFWLQLLFFNVFIQGGLGRMSNFGIIMVDVWIGLYDLIKGFGYRDGMDYLWSCFEFLINFLDMLMFFIVLDYFVFKFNVMIF